jgi:MFS family permease
MTSTDPVLNHQSRRPPTPINAARLSLGLLLTINLFNYVDRQILAAVEPRIQDQFLAGDPHAETKMGLLATAFLVGYMVTAPLFGWLSDRMSRWILIAISVAIWSLASGASGLAGAFTALLITRLFVGIGEAGYGPAAPTIISDLYPISRRGVVLAWFYMAIPVGSALGYIFGGEIAEHFGWRWAFYAVVPPGLLIALASLFMKDPPRGQIDAIDADARESAAANPATGAVIHIPAREPSRARLADYLSLFSNKSFMLDTMGMAAMTFAISGISFWIPRYFTTVRHLELGRANLIFGAIIAFAGLKATLIGGWTGDKLRAIWPGSYFTVSGIAIFISCPCVLMMAHTQGLVSWIWLYAAAFFLFFNTGPSNTILANVTDPNIRASAFGLNILVIHALGDLVAPPLLGSVAHYSWNAAWGVVTIVMAIAGIIWLFGARYLQADTQAVLQGEGVAGRGFDAVDSQPGGT